jgi:hypothetical protein
VLQSPDARRRPEGEIVTPVFIPKSPNGDENSLNDDKPA